MNFKTFVLICVLLEAAAVSGKYENHALYRMAGGNGDKNDPSYYRLPNSIIPKTYDLCLLPFMEVGNFSFKGNVTIKLAVKTPASNITFHTKGINVTQHSLYSDVYPTLNISILKVIDYVDRDFHVLFLKNNLPSGNYTLSMNFEGKLKEDLDGFYISSYQNASGQTEWMAVTQFESISARKAFPCFDEPSLKANFTISIARQKNMTTLSNMPLEKKSSMRCGQVLPPNYIWDNYMQSPKMSTYLVAFAVSKFKENPPNASQTFHVWSRENAITQTDYSDEVGPKILDVMKNITAIKYALPKMDLIAIPDFQAGAMENWGLVTFRETDLLYQDNVSTTYNKQQVITTVAHELSHQWFGDLVSPRWWTYLWLNEGFATYWMYVVTDIIEPSWRMMDQFVIDNIQQSFIPDAMEFTSPIDLNITNPNVTGLSSSDILYGKAGSVIRMMENIFTRHLFFKGLGNYLNQSKFSSANEDTLFDALNVVVNGSGALPPGVSVGDVWRSWTRQPGYPLVTVKRTYSLGHANISQERFKLEDFNSDSEARWWIPLSYTTQSNMNFSKVTPSNWISSNDSSIKISDIPIDAGWVIFNIQSSSYYRVNYDEKNWKLLISFLKSINYTQIHPVNRAQLLDDALNLARRGYIQYTLALNLSQYLSQETDFIPWYSAYNSLEFLDTLMANSTYYPYFQFYAQSIMNSLYKNLTFNESSSDSHVTRLSRSMMLPHACKYNNQDCVQQAYTAFRNWKHSNVNKIPANLRNAVYCYGIAKGGKGEWDFLWDAYLNTTIAAERVRILEALACSKNESILNGYLNKTLEVGSKIRLQDKSSVFKFVYSRANGLDVALKFLFTRFNDIKLTIGEGATGNVILGISNRLSTLVQIYQMKEFLRKNEGNLGVAESSADMAEENMSNNLKWVKNYSPIIESWLFTNYHPSSSTLSQASLVLSLLAILLSYCFQ